MEFHDFIWDLGGTLIDNYGLSARVFQQALKDYGVEVDYETVYNSLKLSTDTAMEQFIPNNFSFYQHYKSLEKEALKEPLFCIGAEEFLRQTYSEGCRHFLISNRDNQTLSLLDKLGVRDMFTEVVTSESGFPKKPSPDSMLHLKEKYHLTRALVLGDRQIDKEAGEAAGFDVFLVDEAHSLLELLKG